MTNDQQAIASGAQHVEETEELTAGLSAPRDNAPAPVHDGVAVESTPEHRADNGPVGTALEDLQLSMFAQGGSVRVRVGSPRNGAELYEGVFESADEANQAMLDGEILTPEQVPDSAEPAGTAIALGNVTAEQLLAAGLKRHGSPTYSGKQ